jgi:glycosyltransferase involved in cell wall biosynthesis
VRVLVVDHTSLLSGGGRSLLELLAGLPDDVQATLACPPGALADAASAGGTPTVALRGTAGSFRLHPVHTTRAVAEIAAMGLAVARHARRTGADVIHANSIRAGLVAVAARRVGAPPIVAHLRDVLPPGRASGAVRRTLRRGAGALIAISHHVAQAFGDEDAEGPAVRVIYNAVDLERFDPATMTREEARARLGLPQDGAVVSVVAQITPWKGQIEAIDAFALVHASRPDARLVIAGEAKFVSSATRYDNAGYERELHRRVAELGLDDKVRFLGEVDDVPAVLRASDATLLPSWDEPFGRTVAEAMVIGTPVLATAVGGPREIVEHEVDGLLLAPRDPERWGRELLALLDDPERRERMAARARARAVARFGRDAHAAAVTAVYREVLDGSSR